MERGTRKTIVSILLNNTTQCPSQGLNPVTLHQESTALTIRPMHVPLLSWGLILFEFATSLISMQVKGGQVHVHFTVTKLAPYSH